MPNLPLSVAQVAEKTGTPKRTIRYAISIGDLKAHKLPGATGAYLIYPRELDRWMSRRQVKAG
jgi:hypothetical protein